MLNEQFLCQKLFMFKYSSLREEWQETVSFLPLASSRQFDTGYMGCGKKAAMNCHAYCD
jgi:hypothetical protein